MLQAALRAAELEPNLTEAQVHVATAKSRAADWNAAESAYRRAYAAQPNVAAPRYAVHLLGAGQLEKARELTSIARATDPLNRTVRGFNILASALTGDQAAADSDYERATATYGGGQWIGSWFITMSRLEPGRALRLEAIPSFNAPPLNQQAREHFSSPAEGLAVLRERWAGPELGTSELLVVGVWAAYFGDAPFALEALEVAIKRNAQNALNLWLPSARELRQLPRFKAFVAEIGLVDYWRQYGWPDLCRPLGAEDFTCG
jgi:hypothetical protein